MLEPIPMLVPSPLWSLLQFRLFRSKSRSIPIPENNWNHSTLRSVYRRTTVSTSLTS